MHTANLSTAEYERATAQLHNAWENRTTVDLWDWFRNWFGVPRF